MKKTSIGEHVTIGHLSVIHTGTKSKFTVKSTDAPEPLPLPLSVMRGDYGEISVGSYSAIEDNCVIHARP